MGERADRFFEGSEAGFFFGGDFKNVSRIAGIAGAEGGGEGGARDFVEGDEEGLFEHLRTVGGKFAAEHEEFFEGIAGFLMRGKFNEVDEGGAPLDVAEEGEAEAAVNILFV